MTAVFSMMEIVYHPEPHGVANPLSADLVTPMPPSIGVKCTYDNKQYGTYMYLETLHTPKEAIEIANNIIHELLQRPWLYPLSEGVPFKTWEK